MRFYSYKMLNTSTRVDKCNHITIEILDGISSQKIGVARVISFNDIYVDIPGNSGRYRLSKPAIRAMSNQSINTLDDCIRLSWLLSEGRYIMTNLRKIK